MEINIPAELAANPTWAPALEIATRALQAAIGRAPHPPTAAWRPNPTDPGSLLLDLRYFDQDWSIAYSMSELLNEEQLRRDLSQKWGKLLVKDFRATADRIVKTLGELREDLREPQHN